MLTLTQPLWWLRNGAAKLADCAICGSVYSPIWEVQGFIKKEEISKVKPVYLDCVRPLFLI